MIPNLGGFFCPTCCGFHAWVNKTNNFTEETMSTPLSSITKTTIARILLFVFIASTVLPGGAMDMARVETRTDLAVSTYAVTGRNVIVAIIDRGIDWRNNDFRNEDGSTRIKYIFDLTDNTGANAPGNTYGVGTIYTEAQINAALTGGPALVTRDAVGHGTTTTGLAAGNGRNLPDRRYRGVAPEASIIAVKFTTEGAPAHGDQPAEAAFYNEALFPTALDFVRDKSAQLGMPAVMLANFGTINGPTDGTSALSRKIDSTVGPGKPGIVFVTGTGDDGGRDNHAGGIVTQGGTASIQIEKVSTGALRIDLWYPGTDRFTVSFQTPSGNFGPYTAPNNGTSSFVQNATFNYYHRGVGTVFYGSTNQKREIFIDLLGPAGTYTLNLGGATVTNGQFDATMNPSRIGTPLNRFLNFVVPGSLIDQATALYNVAPNSYVHRTTWTDIDGVPRSFTGQGTPGQLWFGSSVGMTFDGRLGVDLSAPGDRVVTTYNPTSHWGTFRGNLVQGGNGLYGVAGAVSAAAPQVTGIIALMLQKNPRLDASQIKAMLRNSARSDSFTGIVPNPNWGYGKVDALNAVRLAAQSARTQFDFDGDGKSDVSVFRPSGNTWYMNRSTDGFAAVQWGLASDKLAPADYDGDGKTDVAVWRESDQNFYILNSSDNSVRIENFGLTGDVVTSGDWDGDGEADISVYRPGAQSTFYYRGSMNNPTGNITYVPWGTTGDVQMQGDYDGDGKLDAAVFRGSNATWYIRNSATGSIRYDNWGVPTDKFIPADYDGDGRTDLAVFRDGLWYIKQSSDSQARIESFGLAGDSLAPADYDGDGRADIAVFRNGTWYLRRSSSGLSILTFGTTGDTAVPSVYVP